MTWTDRHGRPEIVMHPDIKRGVTFYRREAALDEPADPPHDQPVAAKSDLTKRRSAVQEA